MCGHYPQEFESAGLSDFPQTCLPAGSAKKGTEEYQDF
jgi:hypothetical protein